MRRELIVKLILVTLLSITCMYGTGEYTRRYVDIIAESIGYEASLFVVPTLVAAGIGFLAALIIAKYEDVSIRSLWYLPVATSIASILPTAVLIVMMNSGVLL